MAYNPNNKANIRQWNVDEKGDLNEFMEAPQIKYRHIKKKYWIPVLIIIVVLLICLI